LHYVDVRTPWFHGNRYLDITGEQLALVRTVESVPDMAVELGKIFPCARIDVFVDVLGNLLPQVKSSGTKIYNSDRLETVYSAHLRQRGDKPVFARAYDAKAAGHYIMPTTRFEVEYKKEYAAQLLTLAGWRYNPIAVALNHIAALLGVKIWVDDVMPIEWEAIGERLSHSRERFYARYGKGIIDDISTMGVQGLHRFIMECLQNGKDACDDQKED
jgi:hypothetical protein